MVFDRNIELKEKQQNLLAELRKLVGRGFVFSEAYLKQCNWESNRIGEGERQFGKVTKKYVYVPCRAIYTTNDDGTEYGAKILKYSVCTTQGNTDKIALEDLYVKDLEKIINTGIAENVENILIQNMIFIAALVGLKSRR